MTLAEVLISVTESSIKAFLIKLSSLPGWTLADIDRSGRISAT